MSSTGTWTQALASIGGMPVRWLAGWWRIIEFGAIVLVLENPYFTIPSVGGKYAIEDVPPGDYTLVGWHERIKPITRTIHVTAGETTRLDFNIPIPAIAVDAGR